jgi:hypothetical protein
MELQNAAELAETKPPTRRRLQRQARNMISRRSSGARRPYERGFGSASSHRAGFLARRRFHTEIWPLQTAKVVEDTGVTATPALSTNTRLASAATAQTSAADTVAAADTTSAVSTPGVGALVTAIMNGSFQPTYVTDQSQLQETTPVGTDYHAEFLLRLRSDGRTAGVSYWAATVVKQTPFGQDQGWTEPLANFIELPNGQTFNAADVAYYANAGCGRRGATYRGYNRDHQPGIRLD